MPVTLIEAAMAGVPAVASAVGSTGEVVLNGRTGLTVAAAVTPLAAAVRSLLSDPGRRQEFGRAARSWAHGTFSVERMTAAHMELYETLVAAPSGSRLRPRSHRWP
jgi:glycosyltransferase involved in cell wall biosynthesis